MAYVVRSAGDLGRAVAELRRARGLSQQDVAEALGIDRSYLAKLETGHSSPLLELILDVLGQLEATVVVTARDDERG